MLKPAKLTLALCAIIPGVLATSVPLAVAADSVELVSHRAAYTVALANARSDAEVDGISGQVAYGVEKVCGGWLVAQSNTVNLHLPTGEVAGQTLNFSSWESDDANHYRFSVKTDAANDDAILGSAQIAPGGAGSATFARPEAATFALPAGTLFPTAHSRFIIDAARAGKTQAESFIFEGVDIEGAKLLVAFISPLSSAAKTAAAEMGGNLVNRPGWNFRLGYFDPQNRSGEPLYEIEVDLLDNGVALRWVLDYGSYAMDMVLNKVEPLPKPDC